MREETGLICIGLVLYKDQWTPCCCTCSVRGNGDSRGAIEALRSEDLDAFHEVPGDQLDTAVAEVVEADGARRVEVSTPSP